MVEGLGRLADEDDEAFLMRAERAMLWEQETIRAKARNLVSTAVRAVDKPESVPGGGAVVLRRMLRGPSTYVERRAALLARSLCREMQGFSTGSDPVAQEAYRLLTQLALAAFDPGAADSPDTDHLAP